MSVNLPSPAVSLPDGSRVNARKLTYREARYVQERLHNPDAARSDAARAAGFPAWMVAQVKREIEQGEVQALIQELQATLAEHAVEASLIDAAEIHEYLTDAIRADWCDIENDDGKFKPISQWPSIWRRMKEKGDIEVETKSERSHDGATKDKEGGWDVAGTVTKVKIGFASRVKLLELAMRHRGVNAMASEKIEHVARVENVVVNLAAVCTIEQLLELQRLAQGRDVPLLPESVKE